MTINWQQPEQLEAVNTETGEVVPIEPDMAYWPDDDYGTYRATVGGFWWWFKEDGTALYRDLPYRIRNRAETAETVRAEFDAYKREVSEALKSRWANICSVGCADVFSRFILPEPPAVDPLVEELCLIVPHISVRDGETPAEAVARQLREALAKRGLTITQAEERGE